MDAGVTLSSALTKLVAGLKVMSAYEVPDWLFEDREFRVDLWDAYRQCAPQIDLHYARSADRRRGYDRLARVARPIVGESHWRCSFTQKGMWANR